MKKYLLSTAAVAMVALAAPASAADLAARPYTKAPAYQAPAAPIYNWTGFYIGGHVGGAFNGNNGFGGTSDNSDGRFLGGVQGGADYQFAPNWVLGIEGQYSWVGNNNTTVLFTGAGAGYAYNQNQNGIASVTGRLGYTWGPALLYVKGGWAYQDVSETLLVSAPATDASFGTTTKSNGYTVGAGLEYLFTQNWSGKVEYQYYDFGTTTFTAPAPLAGVSSKNDTHTVKVGLNYRFNLGGMGGGY